jgi:alkylation response protein AidB-like acyl-CoA dehydrogenase
VFTEAIESILADHCTPAAVRAIENGVSPDALWAVLADAGFLELMASEDAGGAGLALDAVFPIFVAFGRHALPLPAAQSIAARVLLPPGMAVPPGTITLAGHGQREADGSISAAQVAFGALADVVLVNVDGQLLLLDAARAERRPHGVRGSLSASLRWPQEAVPPPIAGDGQAVQAFSAAIHAALIAGAMERLFTMTLDYCNERAQFGKPIGKFQAVQHQLAMMAEQVAAAGAAAELAFASGNVLPARQAAAIAKARTSMAVPLVAATAHALHGAIGVTEEFDLQLYIRRLHEWRMAEGSEAYWNRVVGEALLAQPQQTVLDFVQEQMR